MSADVIRRSGLPGVLSFLVGLSLRKNESESFIEMAEASLEVVEKAIREAKVWIVVASPYHDNDTILGVYDDETKANMVAQGHALRMGELHTLRDECVRRGCSYGPLQDQDMCLLMAEAISVQEFEVG